MSPQNLAITLIREELRNKKLTSSLENMGFDCSYYIIDLSCEILLLAGFSHCTEKLFRTYFQLQDTALREINCDNFNEMVEFWAERIYGELMKIDKSQ
jgi:hypothetical protein